MPLASLVLSLPLSLSFSLSPSLPLSLSLFPSPTCPLPQPFTSSPPLGPLSHTLLPFLLSASSRRSQLATKEEENAELRERLASLQAQLKQKHSELATFTKSIQALTSSINLE